MSRPALSFHDPAAQSRGFIVAVVETDFEGLRAEGFSVTDAIAVFVSGDAAFVSLQSRNEKVIPTLPGVIAPDAEATLAEGQVGIRRLEPQLADLLVLTPLPLGRLP